MPTIGENPEMAPITPAFLGDAKRKETATPSSGHTFKPIRTRVSMTFSHLLDTFEAGRWTKEESGLKELHAKISDFTSQFTLPHGPSKDLITPDILYSLNQMKQICQHLKQKEKGLANPAKNIEEELDKLTDALAKAVNRSPIEIPKPDEVALSSPEEVPGADEVPPPAPPTLAERKRQQFFKEKATDLKLTLDDLLHHLEAKKVVIYAKKTEPTDVSHLLHNIFIEEVDTDRRRAELTLLREELSEVGDFESLFEEGEEASFAEDRKFLLRYASAVFFTIDHYLEDAGLLKKK